MSAWNFADVWEVVARARPDALAVSQGERRLSWADFDRRADAVASALLAAGMGRQGKVAQYLYNGPEYLESLYGAFKAGLVPVNTNYRYTEDELTYLWDNADVEAVVFHGSFADRADAVRGRLPGIRTWLWVDDGAGGCPEWATPYEDAVSSGRSESGLELGAPAAGVRASWGRSGDDLLLIYTGGTTGMPKGVMWRQDDLLAILNRTGELRYPEEGDLEDVRQVLTSPAKHPPARLLPGPPLMHGTGLFTALSVLNSGGSVVLLLSRHFDVEQMLDTVERERVTQMSIVGDAFAKPLLAALDANPDRWDIASLWLIVSSGVIWSAEVKAGLLRHNPRLLMVDTLGSSEAIGMARSTSRRGSAAATADFQLGPDTRVITEDGRDVVAGSGERGMVALRGRGPIGYYKDEEKTASTFQVIDGVRWTIPGDFAEVESDGKVKLLGRGSVCINTGGEKVFPEEVEEAIKLHPSVADAVVVGVPDERFGESVTALVQFEPGVSDPGQAALIGWVRERLAGYKAPKTVIEMDTIGRSPSGKVDYRRLREHAIESLAGSGLRDH